MLPGGLTGHISNKTGGFNAAGSTDTGGTAAVAGVSCHTGGADISQPLMQGT